jgi:hypothetical protein
MRIGIGIGLTFTLSGGAGNAPVLLPLTLAREDIFISRADLTIASSEA